MEYNFKISGENYLDFLKYLARLDTNQKEAFERFAATRDYKISLAELTVLEYVATDHPEAKMRHLALPHLLLFWGDRHKAKHQREKILKLLRHAMLKVRLPGDLPHSTFTPRRFRKFRRRKTRR